MQNMIVCPEPPAAKVGERIYAEGGNAMDAAIAAAFAQSVTNPFRCGLGGTGILNYYHAKDKRRHILNFEVTVGSRPAPEAWEAEFIGRSETVGRYILESNDNHIGYRAVMTPGFVRGCWEAFLRFGSKRLSWAELLVPSMELAREGFEVYPYLTSQWGEEQNDDDQGEVSEIAFWSDEAKRIYLGADGSLPKVGDVLVQEDLARTIEKLAGAGGEDFYTGEISQQISADVEENAGLITDYDLAQYRAYQTTPISVNYRGFEISSAPNSTGITILQMLNVLNHFDIANMSHNSAEYIDTLARVFRACFVDYVRLKGLRWGEEEAIEKEVLSLERASSIANLIKGGDRIHVINGNLRSGTTHLVSADRFGNVVSLNHSIGSRAGSGVVTPGLGFLYNNFLCHFNPLKGRADSIEAGKRFIAGPPIIIYVDENPFIAIGASGGSRINSSTAQTVLNVIDHGMGMKAAVTAYRFHSEEQQRIFLEPDFPDLVERDLRSMGNTLTRSSYMAVVQALKIDQDSHSVEAGPDPRGGAGVGTCPS